MRRRRGKCRDIIRTDVLLHPPTTGNCLPPEESTEEERFVAELRHGKAVLRSGRAAGLRCATWMSRAAEIGHSRPSARARANGRSSARAGTPRCACTLERIQRGAYRPKLRFVRRTLLKGCLVMGTIICVPVLVSRMPARQVGRIPAGLPTHTNGMAHRSSRREWGCSDTFIFCPTFRYP